MKPTILPIDYFDPEIFETERKTLFRSNWIFAGFVTDLEKTNDFVTLELGEHSVVIQNCEGTIKAFNNVCTHRFGKIQTEEKGNRPLLCRYHGWFFDANGRPKGIPEKPHFGDLDETTLKSLCLTPWKLSICGKFVFINANLEAKDLTAFLGSTANILEQFSLGMDHQIDCNQLVLDCNWKVAVENTLESYHVPTIHSKSFHKLGSSGQDFTFDLPHSSWTTGVNDITTKNWNRISKHFDSRSVKKDGYFHQFVFPNLTLATTFGNSFSIQAFVPINANQTQFTSWVFSTKLEKPTQVAQVIQKSMNDAIVQFNRQVFDEDKEICAHVQKGVKIAQNEGLLSDIEFRIHEFQKSYLEVLEYAHNESTHV